jgi:hypothetical protein
MTVCRGRAVAFRLHTFTGMARGVNWRLGVVGLWVSCCGCVTPEPVSSGASQPPATRSDGQAGGADAGPPTAPSNSECPGPAAVDPCAGTEGQLGLYEGYDCDGAQPFIVTGDISCREAAANCQENYSLNPGVNLACGWNGREIFRGEAKQGACSAFGPPPGECCARPVHPCQDGFGNGELLMYDCADGTLYTKVADVSCVEALRQCQAVDGQGQDVHCGWNAREIFRSNKWFGFCAFFGPTPDLCL